MKAKGHIARLLAACMIGTALFGGAVSAESITVTADRLNMRKEADASSKSIEIVVKKEELSFISEKDGWYLVTDGKNTGYVMKEYVSLEKKELQADVEANTKPYSASAETNMRVNMRQLPMTDAEIVKVVGKGYDVQIIGQCGDWYQVSYSGRTGYIMGEYLDIVGVSSGTVESAPADTSKEVLYSEMKNGQANARVNMREKASSGSDIVKVVGEGAGVTVLGESGDWYKIRYSGEIGYILKQYVGLISDANGGETLYAAAVSGETTERVNLRKSASTGASVVKVVYKGESVTIEGESGDWYKIECSGREGYILKNYIRLTGGTDKEDETVDAIVPDGFVSYPAARTGATTDRVNLRKEASSGADVIKVLNQNTGVSVLGEQGGFYQVRYGSTLGYISKGYVTLGVSGETDSSENENTGSGEIIYSAVKSMQTTVRVNLRRAPEGDVLHTLGADVSVSVIGEMGSWYKVTYSGSTGYISKAYLAEKSAVVVPGTPETDENNKTEINKGTTAYITGATVNMRKGAGTSFGVIKVLYKGDEITFYSLTDGWYMIKAGEDTGYVSEKYVSTSKPEGVPANPSEDETATGKVVLSDWWTGKIQKELGRGEIATITDVKTGLSFRFKRTGGTNHADAQPLTTQDTAIMYRIYGNKWQWTRRAIWVTVDGVRYAASMNGMPHGESDSMPDNGFEGCFCIHFLNSRTHAGNRWDTAHQAAVQTAYKAGQ